MPPCSPLCRRSQTILYAATIYQCVDKIAIATKKMRHVLQSRHTPSSFHSSQRIRLFTGRRIFHHHLHQSSSTPIRRDRRWHHVSKPCGRDGANNLGRTAIPLSKHRIRCLRDNAQSHSRYYRSEISTNRTCNDIRRNHASVQILHNYKISSWCSSVTMATFYGQTMAKELLRTYYPQSRNLRSPTPIHS